jgi:glycyl-tRNA synthetase
MPAQDLEPIVNLAKRRGFFFPSAEIYGGASGLIDLGPLGVELNNNLKKLWWRRFVQQRTDIVGLDSAILTVEPVLRASGHIENFTDPLIECEQCHIRLRADHALTEGQTAATLVCPNCGQTGFSEPRQFNTMFQTHLGPVVDEGSLAYLRPETAQGIFTNFKLIVETSRKKLPFGIAQIGKAFRNEITIGNSLFRVREFEQAEIEYFVKPGTDEVLFDHWLAAIEQFLLQDIGLRPERLRRYEHPRESLSHYSKRTVDLEYDYPFGGWGELWGCANRTDYDLRQHQEHSKQDLSYFDEESRERYLPYVIEPSVGLGRLFLTALIDAYEEYPDGRDGAGGGKETALHLKPELAPVKVAVLPLMKKDGLADKAREVFSGLAGQVFCQYDEAGAIGRRYRRQDEIGTPYCVTIDYQTLDEATRDPEGATVTLRDRDSMRQERVAVRELGERVRHLM